jgi:chromosome partitioning protein
MRTRGYEVMKVIALASDKGGMGKSTAALNLACAASESGLEVAILDLDPQASVGRWARVRKKAGLPSRPLAETCVPIDVEDRLEELREAGADLVLLDTAGRDNNAVTAAVAAADFVLVPCHPTDLELSSLGPTFARLRADKKPHYVLLIDWNAGATLTGTREPRGAARMPLRLSRERGDRSCPSPILTGRITGWPSNMGKV